MTDPTATSVRLRDLAAGALVTALLGACGSTAATPQPTPGVVAPALSSPVSEVEPPPAAPTAPPTTVPPVAAATPVAPPADPSELPPPAPSPPPGPRVVHTTGWSPFATVGPLVLTHPSDQVERVGFHESNHDGARQMDVAPSAAGPVEMSSRDRGTGSRTAADIVVAPAVEIRAPITGTVKRAGTYTLYCEYRDDFVVIEPDDRPGWEVKLLHIDGVRVRAGDRVQAGVTVLAGGPTPLPFRSQVDDHTVEPSWAHVHLEVVDTAIPDRPSPGGGC